MSVTQEKVVAIFGEAEKGLFGTAYYLETLPALVDHLGQPPPESTGLFYAVQALLFRYTLLFFRVREEGLSVQDYQGGLKLLCGQNRIKIISAIGMPGVGNPGLIDLSQEVCRQFQSVLIFSEADLYDYLTNS